MFRNSAENGICGKVMQCSKLRVRTAPGAPISVDGRTFFRAVRPVCACFFSKSVWLYTRGVHGQAAGCTFYEPVRPDGAQNKSLISNTGDGTE